MKLLLLIPVFLLSSLVFAQRDPFWPIGYTGSETPAPPEAEPEEPAPVQTRELTDAELKRLAEEEAVKIKQILDRKATAVFGGNVHALVNGKWVKVGDSITVTTLGNTYRLEIIALTTDNIALEPHRSPAGPSGN